ncbi:amidase family protein [Pseudoscardovia suis]
MDMNTSADGAAASKDGAAANNAAGSIAQSPVSPASRAFDTTIWRIVGNPLIPSPIVPSESEDSTASASANAPLQGLGIAVKDLFAVKGFAIGAGNPRFLADSTPQAATAPAVERLLQAGAHAVGIAQTDEFAYSLAGTNVHYGTPPNPAAPGRISGGSSSGPAAAVATGQADIGLGTDTAGSLRIPGSYEGLWAIRTTHGRVPRDLVHPLSEAFDTVGVLARDPRVFVAAVDALMPDADSMPLPVDDGRNPLQSLRLRIAPGLDRDVQPDVAAAVRAFRDKAVALASGADTRCGADGSRSVEEVDITEAQLDDWEAIFQVVRGFEAWRANGAWVSGNWDALAPEIAARFERDSHITQAQYEQGLCRLDMARTGLREWMHGSVDSARGVNASDNGGSGDFVDGTGTVLLIPTASSVAPPRDPADSAGGSRSAEILDGNSATDSAAAQIAQARAATIRLTSLAGVGGLPAVSIPLRTASTEAAPEGLPCGVCLIGPAGSDRSLARLAVRLARRLGAI